MLLAKSDELILAIVVSLRVALLLPSCFYYGIAGGARKLLFSLLLALDANEL